MKIINNRTRGAWFNYKVGGMPKRVYLKPYETFEVSDFTNVDQTLHNRTISNYSEIKPAVDSGQTTNVTTVKNVAAVDTDKKFISTAQQVDGNFSIKYTSQS